MQKLLILIMMLSALANAYGQKSAVRLIPQPVEIKQLSGTFKLSSSSSISYDKPEAKKSAELLAQKLNKATGFGLKASQGKSGAIQLTLLDAKDSKLGKEGYTMEVNSGSVVIKANEPAGLFYGTQSLLQLFPKEIESNTVVKGNWTAPAVKITDYPRFAWRGVMLDVSRNFFTKEDVKKYIDEISRFKYNTFHWHLTDDNGWRIEIKSLPKLTEVGAWRVPRTGHFGDRAPGKPGEAATQGGFYTQDDIREVLKYAEERNVTVIPEIDIPGHSMAAIAAYPELSCTKNPNTKVDPGTNFAEWFGNGTFKMFVENALNPSDEKVYEFLDKVFTEVAAVFPSQYIHVGGDECYKGFWAQDEGCQALMKKLKIRHVEDLQGYFMNRVETILKSKGKKLLGWDEIMEGGISPEATLMSWRGMKYGIEAAKLEHDVVMSPTTFTYIDYCQGDPTVDPPIYANLRLNKCYSFEPVPEGVNAKYILGGQANLWTEHVPTLRKAEYMTYPRCWALSEVYWSPKETKNWDNFVQRVESHFDRADVAQINYSKALYDVIVKSVVKQGKVYLVLSSEISGIDIYYTIDDSMPDNFSPKYSQPVEMPDNSYVVRVIGYRNGKPIGHMITINREELKNRSGNE